MYDHDTTGCDLLSGWTAADFAQAEEIDRDPGDVETNRRLRAAIEEIRRRLGRMEAGLRAAKAAA